MFPGVERGFVKEDGGKRRYLLVPVKERCPRVQYAAVCINAPLDCCSTAKQLNVDRWGWPGAVWGGGPCLPATCSSTALRCRRRSPDSKLLMRCRRGSGSMVLSREGERGPRGVLRQGLWWADRRAPEAVSRGAASGEARSKRRRGTEGVLSREYTGMKFQGCDAL